MISFGKNQSDSPSAYPTERTVLMKKNVSSTLGISYDKLWKLLIDRKMKKKDLQFLTNLSSAVIAKLGKNQTVHMSTLIKICEVLHCNLFDIMELTKPVQAN